MSLLLLLSPRPQPFHPETLHRHVRELEQVYAAMPTADTNGRTAVAMSIVTATASFVEGCLDELLRRHLLKKIGDDVLVDDLLQPLRSLERKVSYAKKRTSLLGRGWQVKDDAGSQFVLGQIPPALLGLRNAISHGAPVAQADLRLSDVTFFRRAACEFLEQVYSSFGDPKPAWLGA